MRPSSLSRERGSRIVRATPVKFKKQPSGVFCGLQPAVTRVGQMSKRRPISLLLRWVNTLLKPPRDERDLHRAFSDGLTLCALLQRLRPSTNLTPFVRAPTRGTALANLEQALALFWQHSPQVNAMPTAEQERATIHTSSEHTLMFLHATDSGWWAA